MDKTIKAILQQSKFMSFLTHHPYDPKSSIAYLISSIKNILFLLTDIFKTNESILQIEPDRWKRTFRGT